MGVPTAVSDVTDLLARARGGDEAAVAQLVPAVYDQLRALAASYLRRRSGDHTLQATALVHEVFLRLVRQDGSNIADRNHFFAVAATAMRQILTDHARRRRAAKRGGVGERVTLSDLASPEAGGFDVVVVDEALSQLEAVDARQARIVELRLFGGLTIEEVAEVLKLSPRTINKEWRLARAWLSRALAPDPVA